MPGAEGAGGPWRRAARLPFSGVLLRVAGARVTVRWGKLRVAPLDKEHWPDFLAEWATKFPFEEDYKRQF